MILCDYCTLAIDTTLTEGPDRRISNAINRPPDPPTQSFDLHAHCVDPWVEVAKQIHQLPKEA